MLPAPLHNFAISLRVFKSACFDYISVVYKLKLNRRLHCTYTTMFYACKLYVSFSLICVLHQNLLNVTDTFQNLCNVAKLSFDITVVECVKTQQMSEFAT